jgi:hypothetical protein
MVGEQAMSEFKFACPVCGQHITADSATSGGQVECPTCFRKIVIPQAPADPDSKFILSAAQAGPRKSSGTETIPSPHRRLHKPALSRSVLTLLLVLSFGSATAWLLRQHIFQPAPHNFSDLSHTNSPPAIPEGWTLNLSNAPLQDTKVTGRILGVRFNCETVKFEGGVLSFFQNPGLPSERRVAISLFAHRPERLADKTFEVRQDRTGPRPRVLLEVRHAGETPATKTQDQDYALRMEFGEITEERLPGRIYLAIADAEKSFLSGRFQAQIVRRARERPQQPANSTPKP